MVNTFEKLTNLKHAIKCKWKWIMIYKIDANIKHKDEIKKKLKDNFFKKRITLYWSYL